MIAYLDTSALVKKYFQETFTDDIIGIWRQAEAIVTSAVAYAEAMAAFYRKNRENPVGAGRLARVIKTFQADWGSLIRVEVTNDLNPLIDDLVSRHGLRGFDAIHLASALIFGERAPEPLLFACFDEKLLQAALKEGLETFPGSPGSYPSTR